DAADATLLALGSSAIIATEITPSTAVAGSAGFTLTVKGGGFDSSSRVRRDGSDRPTSLVSATELRATISAEDLVSSSVLRPIPITVRDLSSGLETFPVMFTVTASGVTQASSMSVSPGDTETASVLPDAAGEAGVTASLTNPGNPFGP